MCQRQPQARAARAAGPHQQDRHSETPNRRVVRLEAQTPTAMQFIQDNSKQGIALRAQNNRKGNNSNQKHTEHTHTHTHTHTQAEHTNRAHRTHTAQSLQLNKFRNGFQLVLAQLVLVRLPLVQGWDAWSF